MAEDEDKDSKTEEPTSKRLQDSRDKGQVASSREVGTAFLFIAALGLFFFQGRNLWLAMQNKMRLWLSSGLTDDLTQQGLVLLVEEVVTSVAIDLMPFFIVFVIVGILSGIVQHGFLFSLQAIAPQFSKVNPLQGLKRLFSMRSVVELFKSIIKMAVVALAVYLGVKDSALKTISLPETSIEYMVDVVAEDTMAVFWRVALAFLALALFDFIYQKFEYVKGLRMSKQEVKDELKQMEGDPLLKARIRQIQREMAQNRMMQEVPQADVVITNPTRYAAAIVYKAGEMGAPKLLAKGRGPVAKKIREAARENNIPLVENPPLARSIYRDVELNQFIPPDLFKAVAEVLAYVYGLRGGQGAAARGVSPAGGRGGAPQRTMM